MRRSNNTPPATGWTEQDRNARPVGANLADAKRAEHDQRELRQRIRAEFYGTEEHLLARRALLDEPILTERFEAYVKAGGPAIKLDTIPKYRRVLLIEQRLDEFDTKRSKKPCDACGSYALRWPSHGSPVMDPNAAPPGHSLRTVVMDDEASTKRTLLLCGNCQDEHAHRSEGILGLARAVFSATAGYRSTPGANRAWLAIERPEHQNDGTPWGHVNRAAIIGHAKTKLRSGEWIPSRLVTNKGQANLLTEHLPGVTAHIWQMADIPAQDMPEFEATLVDPDEQALFTALAGARTTRKAAIATAERDLNTKTGAFIEAHPIPVGGYADKDASAYDELLKAHRKALVKIDDEFYAAQTSNQFGASQMWTP